MPNDTSSLAFPWLPFPTRWFLTAHEVIVLPPTSELAYVRLMFAAWEQQPTVSLPDDDELLATIARMPLDEWITKKARILKPGSCWSLSPEDGRWHHAHLDEKYADAVASRARRAAAGRTNGKQGGRGKKKQPAEDKPEASLAATVVAAARVVYPRRGALSMGWADAERAIDKHLRAAGHAAGLIAGQMIDGARRYARVMDAVHALDPADGTGTSLVKMASTFFGPGRHWEDEYDVDALDPRTYVVRGGTARPSAAQTAAQRMFGDRGASTRELES